jgi:hypothetical protein
MSDGFYGPTGKFSGSKFFAELLRCLGATTARFIDGRLCDGDIDYPSFG